MTHITNLPAKRALLRNLRLNTLKAIETCEISVDERAQAFNMVAIVNGIDEDLLRLERHLSQIAAEAA